MVKLPFTHPNKFHFILLEHRLTAPNITRVVQKQMDGFIKHDINAQMGLFMMYETRNVNHVMKSNAK